MSNAEKGAAIFQKSIGDEEGPSDWVQIDQEQVNAFADCTYDHQFIHVDPERAKQTPFGGPIAHGFLTLSLLPHLQSSLGAGGGEAYQGVLMGVNYGLDKMRLPAPVPAGGRVRLSLEIKNVREISGGAARACLGLSFEVEGAAKPACTAEAVYVYYP